MQFDELTAFWPITWEPEYSQIWGFILSVSFDVYLHVKNKLHHSFLSRGITFSRILQFDWLIAFWPITREPESCQIWVWWWNINNISFHFRLFQRKTNDKICQKIQKKTILGPFWAFLPNFGLKQIFLEKRVLPVFTYSN